MIVVFRHRALWYLSIVCALASCATTSNEPNSLLGNYIEKERAPGVIFIEAHATVRIIGTISARNTWAERASLYCKGKKFEEILPNEYEYTKGTMVYWTKRGYALCEDATVSRDELEKIRRGLL